MDYAFESGVGGAFVFFIFCLQIKQQLFQSKYIYHSCIRQRFNVRHSVYTHLKGKEVSIYIIVLELHIVA